MRSFLLLPALLASGCLFYDVDKFPLRADTGMPAPDAGGADTGPSTKDVAGEDGGGGDGEDVGLADADVSGDVGNDVGADMSTADAGVAGSGAVLWVEHVTIDTTAATASVELARVADNAVPFMTKSLSGTGSSPRQVNVDLAIENGTTVTLSRNEAGSELSANVAVVQFDPEHVRVQSGTFSMSGDLAAVDLPSPVTDTASAFVMFAHQVASSDPRHDVSTLSAEWAGVQQFSLSRAAVDGDVSGHWWVAESLDDTFSVEHLGPLAMPVENGAVSVATSAPLDRSIVLYSYEGRPDPADAAYAGCWLAEMGRARCERSRRAGGIRQIQLQIVTWAEAAARHGELTVDGQTAGVFLEPAVDRSLSVVLGGAIGVQGANYNTATDDDPAHLRLQIATDGGTMEAIRGVTTETATAHWSVLEFP